MNLQNYPVVTNSPSLEKNYFAVDIVVFRRDSILPPESLKKRRLPGRESAAGAPRGHPAPPGERGRPAALPEARHRSSSDALASDQTSQAFSIQRSDEA